MFKKTETVLPGKRKNKKTFEIPLGWFVCPVTKEKFRLESGSLCSSFGCFKRDDTYDFWNFMPDNLKKLHRTTWQVWNKLQKNGLESYLNDPIHNLGVGKRQDYIDFSNFCNFQGIVLDVGVGPQKIPTHLKYNKNIDNVFFIGIDPLIGVQPRSFPFVLGLGEYLPFRDELFDQILYVTSLDHFIDPLITIMEATRVLKKDGTICIWIGEKKNDAPNPRVNNAWYTKLKKPNGADDVFHFKRLSDNDFEKLLKKTQLKIAEKKETKIDQWRTNYFYKIRKYG